MTDCIRGHERPARATRGYLCDHHDDLLAGWLADIEDWFTDHRLYLSDRLALTLSVTDTRNGWNETGGQLNQNAPARTLAFWRHLNPLSGRLESNGPDVPDVGALIDTWTQVLVEECPAVTVQPESFAARLALLRGNRLWIVEQPWLDEFLNDMRACQKTLAKVVGEATGPRPLGTCPYCGTNCYLNHDLEEWASRREQRERRIDPMERVVCQGCGEQWKGAEVARFRLIQEQEAAG